MLEHRQALRQLRGLADRDLLGLLEALSGLGAADTRIALIEVLPELLEPYILASGELAGVLFEDLRLEAGRRGVFYAENAGVVKSVTSTAHWAVEPLVNDSLASTVFSRLSGAIAKQIMDASRDTMQVNGAREGVRFQRMARADACAFCMMLASRPEWMAYTSEAAANSASHDDCQCVVMPVYPGTEMAELARVERERAEDKYRQALTDDDGNSLHKPKDILAQMRKEHGIK